MDIIKSIFLWVVSIIPSLFTLCLLLKDASDIRGAENSWNNTDLNEAAFKDVKLRGVADEVFARITCNVYLFIIRKEIILLTISALFPIALSYVQLIFSNTGTHGDIFRNVLIGGISVCGVLTVIQAYKALMFMQTDYGDFFLEHKTDPEGAVKKTLRFNLFTIIVVLLMSGIVTFTTMESSPSAVNPNTPQANP